MNYKYLSSHFGSSEFGQPLFEMASSSTDRWQDGSPAPQLGPRRNRCSSSDGSGDQHWRTRELADSLEQDAAQPFIDFVVEEFDRKVNEEGYLQGDLTEELEKLLGDTGPAAAGEAGGASEAPEQQPVPDDDEMNELAADFKEYATTRDSSNDSSCELCYKQWPETIEHPWWYAMEYDGYWWRICDVCATDRWQRLEASLESNDWWPTSREKNQMWTDRVLGELKFNGDRRLNKKHRRDN